MILDWEEGKTYQLRNGLLARITRIRKIAVPKETTEEELQDIESKSEYGIEGVVTCPVDSNFITRGCWTLLGEHLPGEVSDGDLLTTRVITEKEINAEKKRQERIEAYKRTGNNPRQGKEF